jgi:O-antigen/teichoic acid export membrane protein
VKQRKPSSDMLLDIAGLIGSRLMLVIFGFGTGIITARILGPHDRGLFTLLIMLPQTLVTFAKMGVAQANVYYVRGARASVSTVASNSLVLTFAVSVPLLAACYFFGHWIIDPFTDGAPWSYVWLALVLVPALSTAISYSLAAGILLTVFVRESGSSIRDTVLVARGDLARYPALLMTTGARFRRPSGATK